MGEDKSRVQRDIKELFSCKLGIESAKITERKVSENRVIKAIENASTPWRALNGIHSPVCVHKHAEICYPSSRAT